MKRNFNFGDRVILKGMAFPHHNYHTGKSEDLHPELVGKKGTIVGFLNALTQMQYKIDIDNHGEEKWFTQMQFRRLHWWELMFEWIFHRSGKEKKK